MTNKEKVLKNYPTAYCKKTTFTFNWHKPKIKYQIIFNDKVIAEQFRESWAWADAYRNIKK